MARFDHHPAGRFCWVDLDTHDLGKAERFYAAVFGWDHFESMSDDGVPYLMFTRDGEIVAGFSELTAELKKQGIPSTWNHYVAVEDADACVARAGELGAKVLIPVTAAADAGRFACLQDPTGGAIGIWESGDHAGFAVASEDNSVCWHELATRDLPAASEFFEELFGWTTSDNPMAPAGYRTIQAHGEDIGGILQMNDEWGDMPPHWTVYFAVEDADQSAAEVEKAGGKVHYGPFDTPIGRLAVCADDQGSHFHVIALEQSPA